MTDMQITKVWIRGEMPENCIKCSRGWDCASIKCMIMGRYLDEEVLEHETRPSWCPLELEKEGEE